MSQLNEKEIKTVSEFLSKLEPGELPLSIFAEICKICVLSAVEIVPLRTKENKIQVLLTKRSKDDPFWPGQWHIPGSVIRSIDELGNFNNAIERIIKDELVGIEIKDKPVFIQPVFRDLGRGKEVVLLYWMQVEGETKDGEYFNCDDLPNNMIEKQKECIEIAIKCFKKN